MESGVTKGTADLESTPAEFTCSRGTREKVNPAAQRLERHPVDALPQDPDHDLVPRSSSSNREMSWRMGRRIAARVVEH